VSNLDTATRAGQDAARTLLAALRP
jgi:hypothetical protein